MKVTAQVIGREEVQRAIEGLQVDIQATLESALNAGALPIQNAWKQKAPVKTGSYRRSIHTETSVHEAEKVEVQIGTSIIDPPYPLFLEQGTRKMAPRPSMRPAFDENHDKAVREVATVFKQLAGRHGS